MNKMVKVLILLVLTLLLTTTLMIGNTAQDNLEFNTLLFKGSATLHKSYASMFLLVNEITLAESHGDVDFLTAQATVEKIKYTLLDSRDYFARANEMNNSDVCRRRIGDITELLEEMDSLGNNLKQETIPSGKVFRALNAKYLECLRIDAFSDLHTLKQ